MLQTAAQPRRFDRPIGGLNLTETRFDAVAGSFSDHTARISFVFAIDADVHHVIVHDAAGRPLIESTIGLVDGIERLQSRYTREQ